MKPILILNLKSYKAGFYELEQIIEAANIVSKEFPQIDFALAPNVLVAMKALSLVYPRVKVYLQHVDPVDYGAFTGHIPLMAAKELGFGGALVNHSERRVSYDIIHKIVSEGKELSFNVIVCVGDLREIPQIAKLKPTYIAYEPPELIGTGISVSKAKPQDLAKSVHLIREFSEGESIPICGAGISSNTDVAAAIDLGAQGVLVASAFVKAKNRVDKLREFAMALEQKL